MCIYRPRRNKLRTCGEEHHDGQFWDRLNQQAEELYRGRVEPVSVLYQNEHRSARRQLLDTPQQGRQRPFLAFLRRKLWTSELLVDGQGKKVGYEYDLLAPGAGAPCQQRCELG